VIPCWLTRERYQEYIRSPRWKYVRRQELKRAHHQCQLCGRQFHEKDLTVHHNCYDRFGSEKPQDLTVVCEQCHRRIHGIEPEYRPWNVQNLVTFGAAMENAWERAVGMRQANGETHIRRQPGA